MTQKPGARLTLVGGPTRLESITVDIDSWRLQWIVTALGEKCTVALLPTRFSNKVWQGLNTWRSPTLWDANITRAL